MGEELNLGGKRYISSKRAAQITSYTSDYIGQLCRAGKLECTRVGRSWFVSEDSMNKHVEGQNSSSSPKRDIPQSQSRSSEFTYSSESDLPLMPEVKKSTPTVTKSLPRVPEIASKNSISIGSHLGSALIQKGVAFALAVSVVAGTLYMSDLDRVQADFSSAVRNIKSKTLAAAEFSQVAGAALVKSVSNNAVVANVYSGASLVVTPIHNFGAYMLNHFTNEVAKVPHGILMTVGGNIVNVSSVAMETIDPIFESVLSLPVVALNSLVDTDSGLFGGYIAFGEKVLEVSDRSAHMSANALGRLFTLPKKTLSLIWDGTGDILSSMTSFGSNVSDLENNALASVFSQVSDGFAMLRIPFIDMPASVIDSVTGAIRNTIKIAGESFGRLIGTLPDEENPDITPITEIVIEDVKDEEEEVDTSTSGVQAPTVIVQEKTIQPIIQTILVEGISQFDLDTRIQQLDNKLTSSIGELSIQAAGSISSPQ
ncbi:hypothetical protein COB55_04685, partial [Candidatus Wolfebacteria bacterium]